MICNRCGKELAEDATRCDNCFEEVERIDVEKFKQNMKPKKNTKEIVLIFFLVIVLIFVGIYMVKSIDNTNVTDGLKERKPSKDPISNTVNTINNVNNVVSKRNIEVLHNMVELAYTNALLQGNASGVSFKDFYDKFKGISEEEISELNDSSFTIVFEQGGICTITCDTKITVTCNNESYNYNGRLECRR